MTEFKKQVSWVVTSTREHCTDAGYWTSSYDCKEDAVRHADRMEANAYEVTDEFMWEDGKIVQHVSQTWRLLK